MDLDLNKTSIFIICGVSLLLIIVVIFICVCLYKRRSCLFKSFGTEIKNEETRQDEEVGQPPGTVQSTTEAVLDVFVSTSSQQLPASLELVEEDRRLPRPQLSENVDEQESPVSYDVPLADVSFIEIKDQRDAKDGRNELVLSNISKPVPPTTYSKPRLHDGTHMLDLHGYYLDEAMDLFEEFIQEKKDVYDSEGCQQQDRYAIVITGRGLHSPDGIPVIRNNVVEFLEDEGYNYSFERNNSGRIRVDFA